MFNKLLDKLQGADVYMIISFLIFLLFFIGVSLYLLKSNKKHIERMREMPLENNNNI